MCMGFWIIPLMECAISTANAVRRFSQANKISERPTGEPIPFYVVETIRLVYRLPTDKLPCHQVGRNDHPFKSVEAIGNVFISSIKLLIPYPCVCCVCVSVRVCLCVCDGYVPATWMCEYFTPFFLSNVYGECTCTCSRAYVCAAYGVKTTKGWS